MSHRSILAASLAAVATIAALGVATPAAADEVTGTEYATNTVSDGQLRTVSPLVKLQRVVRLPDNTVTFAWTCEALSVGDAVATRLPECSLYINGNLFRNVQAAYPGPFAAQASSSTTVPVGASVRACVRAQVIWTDNSVLTSGDKLCTLTVRAS
jgi:hypothetical protein